jgi:ABC-type sugar transport system permease subunit
MLFLPSVISGVVLTTLYKYIVGDMYIGFSGGEEVGLLDVNRQPFEKMIVIIVYILWQGFGSNILMYSSAMSGINESMVESSQLDGCNIVQEFFYITIPGIYTTFTTFMVMGMAHIFTNQMALHTFFGESAVESVGFQTLGYYLYIRTLRSPGLIFDERRPFELATPQLAALSLITTCFVLPITLGGRKLMEKLGPSAN